MPKFLQGKPAWMVSLFAVLVLACGLLGADVIVQLINYHTLDTSAALTADDAPPVSTTEKMFTKLFGATPTPSPSPSPSPSAKPETVAELPASPESSSTPSFSSNATADSDESNYIAKTASRSSVATAPAESLPENDEVRLQGVMLGDVAGIAVLDYSGQTYTVSPGDKVGTYRVTDIKADSVTLERHGKRSQVHIDVPKRDAEPKPVTKSVGNYPPVLPPPDDVPLPPQPVSLPEMRRTYTPRNISTAYNITEADFVEPRDVTPPANELTREELDEFTRKGAALMADIRGSEVSNERGVKVEFRNPDNALAKLGMHDGDVVLRINSRSIVGVEDIYNAVLTMRDAPQIDIEIMRNGQPMSLFHKFPEK